MTASPRIFGTVTYHLSRTIQMVWDIEESGIQSGGEQYPNLICVIDAAEQLSNSLNGKGLEMASYSPTAKAAIVELAQLLRSAWERGGLDAPGGPALSDLVDAAQRAALMMPQALDEIDTGK